MKMDTPVTTPVAADLVALANRQNTAMNTIRLNGSGYQAYVTAIHVIGPFGGDTALEIQLGGSVVRKQYADFVDEVAGWETIATMSLSLSEPQKTALRLAGLVGLSTQNVTVLVY
jgi:hypothetical protein